MAKEPERTAPTWTCPAHGFNGVERTKRPRRNVECNCPHRQERDVHVLPARKPTGWDKALAKAKKARLKRDAEARDNRDAEWAGAFAEALGTSCIDPPTLPDAKDIKRVLRSWVAWVVD
ncbi:MAG: hypothetical protein ACRD3I_05645 [Terriglobales bacterium]